jgi:hypothetical protein
MIPRIRIDIYTTNPFRNHRTNPRPLALPPLAAPRCDGVLVGRAAGLSTNEVSVVIVISWAAVLA